ncbi:putative metal-dependent hydrolase [Flavobacterium sp. F-380]|uniref:Metal-dependent hydrolase n=1 Tax=Flavobacterium kayseriense TaxID=2764714 RepID=A0ABR7J6E7_9FLAO|nr:putative metal-dependent hydrolase [Flavobacterium kayseriense]MBC5841110.1 putative metal-dependent hydrolase [Flavobacterium kayseriense]MBC5847638.1 putative metal-dependent hydrolase [Flavobacterium kayseriense]
MTSEDLRYPIGKFETPTTITTAQIAGWIEAIATFPARLANEVQLLTEEQLDTPYRPDGWTIRQVVHHCADSHMNSFIRLKLAITENEPTIKPFDESKWAELADAKTMSIAPSLQMIEGIHERWTVALKNLTEEQYNCKFIHPDHENKIRLDEYIGMYAWHSNHHLAHITSTKRRNNWK